MNSSYSDSSKIIKHIYVVLSIIIIMFIILFIIQKYHVRTIHEKEKIVETKFEKLKLYANEMINSISEVQLKLLKIRKHNVSPVSIRLTKFELIERVKNTLNYNNNLIVNLESEESKYHELNLFKKLDSEVKITVSNLNQFQRSEIYSFNKYQIIVLPILSVLDQYYSAHFDAEKIYLIEIESLKSKQQAVFITLIIFVILLSIYIIMKALKNLKSMVVEKDESEKKLYFSENNFREITENTNEGILVIFDNEYVFSNRAINELLGYNNGDLIGKNFKSIIHPDYLNIIDGRFNDKLEGEFQLGNFEINLLSMQGESIVVEVHPSITHWLGKIALQFFIYDIRERKKEQLLLEQQAVIIDQIHDSVVSTDLEGYITSWNNGAKYLFGYSPQEIIGKHITKLYPESEFEHLSELINTLLISGDHESEVKLIRKNKIVFDGHLSLSMIYEDDKPIGMIGYTVDITGRKLAELELELYRQELEELIESRTFELNETIGKLEKENKERIKLESNLIQAKHDAEYANVQKSEFINRMSHELRTPMNAILGFSQLLELELVNDEHRDYIVEILVAGRHLLEMIDEILDLSRIESGNIKINITAVSVYEVILESISLVQPLASEKKINIINTIQYEDEIFTAADYMRLKEVIINLLTNAIKYNCDAGTITIGLENKSNNVCITVTDTGIGVDSKNPDEIFEPFNRVGAEYTEIQGVGIGLSISKQLIELMDGSIGYDSVAGKGSTFWIELIKSKATIDLKSIEEISPIDSSQLKKANIVYIEDNVANLKLVKHMIKRHKNITLLSRDNAEEGLALIRNVKPDLIILDINLPGMNGFQALELLLKDKDLKDIPVFALSAAATASDIERGLLAGFKRYLTKPIQVDEFINAIEYVFKTKENEFRAGI